MGYVVCVLAGAIKDERVGEDVLADFLLYSLNRVACFRYVQEFGLPAPSDDFPTVRRAFAQSILSLANS
jgi:hypothetical protein